MNLTPNFPQFGKIVNDSFQALIRNQVFETLSGDLLWEIYIKAFPEGTNPVFKTRTEHDCTCCRQFIKRIGGLTDGNKTVWDEAAELAPEPYNHVAKHMRRVILSAEITNVFAVNSKENSFGFQKTRSQAKGDKSAPVITWDHFYSGTIPSRLQSESPDTIKGDYRTTAEVFARGLKELKSDAFDTVLSLADLYRGEEHRPAILAFQKLQKGYNNSSNKANFIWLNAKDHAARFRNTVIGTLITDISEGVDIDKAVRSFETKVAPQNYKRTTSIITPGMIKQAMNTIAELGLESALERRFAKISDINVNDVLWVDNKVKPSMKGGLEDLLMKEVKTSKAVTSETLTTDEFMELLKSTNSLELFIDSKFNGNFVSLTAPVHSEVKQLFKWDNDYAWSYSGNVADSIKERVKKAGGKVTGALRVSLSWYNWDDLDLHIHCPLDHIYFGSRIGYHSKGHLDVDMNAGGPTSREPVENVIWEKTPPDGKYEVVINNFNCREQKDVGFTVEIESEGKVHNFAFNTGVRYKEDVRVATITMKNGVMAKLEVGDARITTGILSQDKWNLKTESFVKVNAVTLSPNFWGNNKVGNKHLFLFLEGCLSDEPTRGIYNEFLNSRLEGHRKVFEVIGDKTKCQPTEGQLSGVGFSSTKRETLIVRVNGKRQYKLEV